MYIVQYNVHLKATKKFITQVAILKFKYKNKFVCVAMYSLMLNLCSHDLAMYL